MKNKKFPSFSQWKQVFKVFKGPERVFFLILLILVFGSFTYLAINFYINSTKTAPSYGGTYTEGVVGQPRFINPIYGETNDIDRTLIGLIYSSLLTYNKDGDIINDLAESYQISEDGKTYTFQLKNNLYWQDGAPLTVDDVIFTIKTIQNSDYKSPLRASWLNVEVKKISDKSLSMMLGSPYNSFLDNCTLKIIPSHIWSNVLAENFALSSYNLQPIGSGFYSFKSISQNNEGLISKIKLEANTKYYGDIPHIKDLNFVFFNSKEDLIKSANRKTIDGFSVAYLEDSELLAEKEVRQGLSQKEKFSVYYFPMPRYFAVFFNTNKARILSDTNLAKALNFSVNKQEFVNKLTEETKNKISVVDSPLLPDYFGYSAPTAVYSYNMETAGQLLDKSGYKDQGNGQRSKINDKKQAFSFKSYLKVGSNSNEVTELQKCLSNLDENFKELLKDEVTGKYGKGTENAITEFQKKYLPDTKPTGETGPGTRTKLDELCLPKQDNLIPLAFTLTTINQPRMVEAANLLKDYWQKAGFSIEIKVVEFSELKQVIKDRDYDALLYGQALGSFSDLYPFWHSTQINDPGLNLSEYQSKTADQLLKDAREAINPETKAEKYEQLQNTIIADAPALFLYNPDYTYWVSGKVKGIETTKIVDPAKRFANISNWYINTKRIWK